jgi:predicted nuclease of predicted toxin-antitoxin system
VKILLDQNISFRVIKLLSIDFDEVEHIKRLGLTNSSDVKIWEYALKNDYTIITFDSDFIDLATLKGSPPKIIWLKFGNSNNLKIANKLLAKSDIIRDFILNKEVDILEII